MRPTKSDDKSCTNSGDKNYGHEVRRVNQKRCVTEERLQQFGRELRSSITKDVTQSVMESVKSIIVETNRKVIKEELNKGRNAAKKQNESQNVIIAVNWDTLLGTVRYRIRIEKGYNTVPDIIVKGRESSHKIKPNRRQTRKG